MEMPQNIALALILGTRGTFAKEFPRKKILTTVLPPQC
jgi:hypothetical protein